MHSDAHADLSLQLLNLPSFERRHFILCNLRASLLILQDTFYVLQARAQRGTLDVLLIMRVLAVWQPLPALIKLLPAKLDIMLLLGIVGSQTLVRALAVVQQLLAIIQLLYVQSQPALLLDVLGLHLSHLFLHGCQHLLVHCDGHVRAGQILLGEILLQRRHLLLVLLLRFLRLCLPARLTW